MPDPSPSITLPGGITVPIPSWTSWAFGLITIAFVAFSTYRYFYPPENARVAAERDHYNKHIFEAPEANFTQDGITVRVYPDDCLVVARKSEARLLLAAAPHNERTLALPPFLPVVEAAAYVGACGHRGGTFTWAYGARLDACWVEVWRTFQDGCQHMQHFNLCSGAWETTATGFPVVTWTRCNH